MSDFTSEFHNTVPISSELDSLANKSKLPNKTKALLIATGVISAALAIDAFNGGGSFDPESYNPGEDEQSQSIDDINTKGPGMVRGSTAIVRSGANIRDSRATPDGNDVARGLARDNVVGQVPEGHNLVIDLPYSIGDKLVCVTGEGKIAWVDVDLTNQRTDDGHPYMDIVQKGGMTAQSVEASFEDNSIIDPGGAVFSSCRLEPLE